MTRSGLALSPARERLPVRSAWGTCKTTTRATRQRSSTTKNSTVTFDSSRKIEWVLQTNTKKKKENSAGGEGVGSGNLFAVCVLEWDGTMRETVERGRQRKWWVMCVCVYVRKLIKTKIAKTREKIRCQGWNTLWWKCHAIKSNARLFTQIRINIKELKFGFNNFLV